MHVEYIKKKIPYLFEEVKYCDLNYFVKNSVYKNSKEKQKKYERLLHETYLGVIASNRVLGIEYSIGSSHHPKHTLSNFSKNNIFDGMNNFFDFWVKEVKKKNIKTIIAGDKEYNAVAKICKIKFRSIERSRHKNFHYWTSSSLKKIPNLEKNFKKIKKIKKNYINTNKIIHRAYDAEFIRRERNLKSLKLKTALKLIVLITPRYIYKRFSNTNLSYNFFSSYKAILLRYFHYKYLKKNVFRSDGLSKEKKIIFFPLHTEPEPQIINNSPFFFFQESLIALVSRHLPSNYTLAVKESIVGIGRRDINFYKKINKFKNVILLDPLEEGIKVIKKSDLVITISGTAGAEAAILGKPVISMSPFNNYNILDHVHYLNNLSDLSKVFNHFLNLNKKKKEKSLKDGYDYLLAIEKSSFDLDTYNHLNTNKIVDISSDNKKKLLTSFIKSIEQKK